VIALAPETMEALKAAVEASEAEHGPGGFTTIVAAQGCAVILAVGSSAGLMAGPMSPDAARALAEGLVMAADALQQVAAPRVGKEWLQ
jgi:hypothetical protein